MRDRTALVCVGLLASLAACDGTEPPITPVEPNGSTLDTELRASIQRFGVMPIGPMPPQGTAAVELGRALFFDPILSGNRDVACASCHDPAHALTDGRSLPVGTGAGNPEGEPAEDDAAALLPRSSPSLLNSGLGLRYLFWDGRLNFGRFEGGPVEAEITFPPGLSRTLETQALIPLLSRDEMRGARGDVDVFGAPNELAELDDWDHDAIWSAVVSRLRSVPEYVERFGAAFPDHLPGNFRIEHVARALATYQREAFTKTASPFDRYLDREDDALTAEQKRGAVLFFGDAGCGGCHTGPFLGGESFANVGVPQLGPGGGVEQPLDLGRGEVAGGEFYRFAFRVAPLRNVELTAPYMHNGAFPTLEDVVRHYDDVPTSLRTYDPSHLPPEVRALHHGDEATVEEVLATLDWRVSVPLDLEEREIADLVAFLEALTDPAARDLQALVPDAVPSGLAVPR